jgi:ABC-type branched-subunit amino acid transport system ATPase component
LRDVLEARSVSKRFGGLIAVDGVTLEVRPGDVHGLTGPNGSGKTTLLNLISGYYPIDEGGIYLAGTDATRQSVQDRARSGLARTFQTPKLVLSLSVLDNAMLGGWPHVRSGFPKTAFAAPARGARKPISASAPQRCCKASASVR